MKNKALVIIITFMLGSAGVLSPAFYASAQAASEGTSAQAAEDEPEKEAQEDGSASAGDTESENSSAGSSKAEGADGILQHGAEFGQELYKKMDEAVDSVDKASLRGAIRDALEEQRKKNRQYAFHGHFSLCKTEGSFLISISIIQDFPKKSLAWRKVCTVKCRKRQQTNGSFAGDCRHKQAIRKPEGRNRR